MAPPAICRGYGRSQTHQRCVASVPHGHWQSSTFIAALRAESIAAPFLIEGAVNAEVFTAYLAQVLCPELRRGDVVVLDNLSTHKIASVAALITARGATVRYLPPYIRSRWPSPNSKRTCARQQPPRWLSSKARSQTVSPPSSPLTARASFVMPVMRLSN